MSSSTYDPPADWPWAEMPDDLLSIPQGPDDPAPDGFWEDWSEFLPSVEDQRLADAAAQTERADPADSVLSDLGLADPALVACAQIAAGLDALAGLAPELVASTSVPAVVDALMCERARNAGLLARYVREVDSRRLYPGTWAGNGVAAYLRHRYRLRPREAIRLADRAEEVVQILPALGRAMVEGTADVEQADMIVTGIDNLPTTATPDQQDQALATLIGRCGCDDPLALGRAAIALGEELTEISEDGPPPEDDAEQDAYERRHLTVRKVPGGVEGEFFAPDEYAAIIQAFLDQLAGPDDTNHGDPTDPDGKDTRSSGQRNIDALHEALAHRLACGIQTPPPATTVLVQLRMDELQARLAGAQLLDHTGTLPASVARRLCCDGQLIPTVLDGKSLPLDLGRSSRLFSPAQRHALALRDRGCSFPNCQ